MKPFPRFVFFGTPDVASETLELLKSHGYIPEFIVTAPQKPVGRHFIMTKTPVADFAESHNIPYVTPEKGSEILSLLENFYRDTERPDLCIVVAYGKILNQQVIDFASHGTLNIHYSLLPKWRGASPVESALLYGETQTGISIQKMVFELDAGPIVAESKIAIDHNDTTQTLRGKLIQLGGQLLAETLDQFSETKTFSLYEQDHMLATKCGKIKKQDGHVDPFTDDPQTLWNKYRAYFGWPGIFFLTPSNKQDTQQNPLRPSATSPLAGEGTPTRVKITKARFENNQFIIERVIPEGKKEMDWDEYKKHQ
jgi:methionyl-tRNA formyltransferase